MTRTIIVVEDPQKLPTIRERIKNLMLAGEGIVLRYSERVKNGVALTVDHPGSLSEKEVTSLMLSDGQG